MNENAALIAALAKLDQAKEKLDQRGPASRGRKELGKAKTEVPTSDRAEAEPLLEELEDVRTRDAEQERGNTKTEVPTGDRAEAELLLEELKDVRTRVMMLAYRGPE